MATGRMGRASLKQPSPSASGIVGPVRRNRTPAAGRNAITRHLWRFRRPSDLDFGQIDARFQISTPVCKCLVPTVGQSLRIMVPIVRTSWRTKRTIPISDEDFGPNLMRSYLDKCPVRCLGPPEKARLKCSFSEKSALGGPLRIHIGRPN